jgi:hypothetical protein
LFKPIVRDVLSNQTALHQFEKYRDHILENYSSQKVNKINNYSREKMPLDNLLGLFSFIHPETEQVMGFVSVARNRVWPNQVARINNRAWIDPQFRSTGLSLIDSAGTDLKKGHRWGLSFAYDAQIECCKRNHIELAVITRQNSPHALGPNVLNSMSLQISLDFPGWTYDSNYYYKTCSSGENYLCWQKLTSLELVPGSNRLKEQIDRKTNSEYEKYFERTKENLWI